MSLRSLTKPESVLVNFVYADEELTMPYKLQDLKDIELMALQHHLRTEIRKRQHMICTCNNIICSFCGNTYIADYNSKIKLVNGVWA